VRRVLPRIRVECEVCADGPERAEPVEGGKGKREVDREIFAHDLECAEGCDAAKIFILRRERAEPGDREGALDDGERLETVQRNQAGIVPNHEIARDPFETRELAEVGVRSHRDEQ